MKNLNLPPAFQQIFFTVVCFTLLSGGASFWFAAKDNLSPQQNRVFETCNTTWNMGIGAILRTTRQQGKRPVSTRRRAGKGTVEHYRIPPHSRTRQPKIEQKLHPESLTRSASFNRPLPKTQCYKPCPL